MKKNKKPIELVLKKNLDFRQEIIFKALSGKSRLDAERYLLSLCGYRMDVAVITENRRKIRNSHYDSFSDKTNGTILNIFRDSFIAKESSHKPLDTKLGEWIGVEIECIIPLKQINIYRDDYYNHDDDDFNEEGFQSDCLRAIRKILNRENIYKYVSVKEDGSIRADKDSVGIEFTVLCLKHDLSNLKLLCDKLESLKARVNTSCGLHIHLDARDLGRDDAWQRAYKLYYALPLLKQMVPPSRLDNEFCHLRISDTEKYSAINFKTYDRYGTIEVRLHSGTTSFEKIANWVELCYIISRSTITEKVLSLNSLASQVSLSSKLLAYIDARIALFSGTKSNLLPLNSIDTDVIDNPSEANDDIQMQALEDLRQVGNE